MIAIQTRVRGNNLTVIMKARENKSHLAPEKLVKFLHSSLVDFRLAKVGSKSHLRQLSLLLLNFE